jgi:hypothetical protein
MAERVFGPPPHPSKLARVFLISILTSKCHSGYAAHFSIAACSMGRYATCGGPGRYAARVAGRYAARVRLVWHGFYAAGSCGCVAGR